MPLSSQAIQEIRDRLKEIEAEHVELTDRLDNLEAEAEPLEQVLDHYAPSESTPVVTVKAHRRKGQGRSFWVKQALESLGRLASPTEVAEEMTVAGFKWDNGMDRKAIVATDLNRLAQAKKGHIKHVMRGQYLYMDKRGAK